MSRVSILMAGAVILAVVAQSQGNILAVNSNSKVEYGIEYSIEIDKSVCDLGEHFEFLYEVTNVTDEDVQIGCSQSPELNVMIRNSQEETVGQLFWVSLPRPRGVRLAPGESRVLAGYSWEMTDLADYPIEPGDNLEPGNYYVVGIMYNQGWNLYHQGIFVPTEIGVEIMIIPEPATFAFLLVGMGLLRLGAKGERR